MVQSSTVQQCNGCAANALQEGRDEAGEASPRDDDRTMRGCPLSVVLGAAMTNKEGQPRNSPQPCHAAALADANRATLFQLH